MGSVIAAIIGAAIAAGTTITTSVLNAQETAEAQAEAEEMWNKENKYRQERTARKDRMDKMNIQMQEKMLAWEQAGERRKTRMQKEAIAYEKGERQYQKGIDLLNQSTNLRNNYVKQFRAAA